MGIRNVRFSDLSGKTLDDETAVTVVVRSAGKLFDADIKELAALRRVTDVVELELRHGDGKVEQILVNQADFNKLVSKEVLAGADTIRGRRRGYKPSKTTG